MTACVRELSQLLLYGIMSWIISELGHAAGIGRRWASAASMFLRVLCQACKFVAAARNYAFCCFMPTLLASFTQHC